MARDVVALVRHLRLDAVGVVGFSMGALTAAKLLALGPAEVKSAVLAGISEYALEGSILEFPKSFPVPEYLPKPLTNKVWAEEGARVLEGGRIVPGHLASAQLVMARATGLDPKALAAVLRGAIAEGVAGESLRRTKVPVLLLNGRQDVANQKVEGLLEVLPHARAAECEGDHYSTHSSQPSSSRSSTSSGSSGSRTWRPATKHPDKLTSVHCSRPSSRPSAHAHHASASAAASATSERHCSK